MMVDEIGRPGRAFPDAPVIVYERLEGSTNRLAKSMALSGAVHGTAVIADSQTMGRGRFGRPFFSPPGRGLYLSLIVRPDWPAENLSLLTVFTAAAVCDAIETVCSRRPAVKWVNDLMLDRHKICGILAESFFTGTQAQGRGVVIGVGINVNGDQFPPELQGVAGSLEMLTGRTVCRKQLAREVLGALALMVDAAPGAHAGYLRRYRADCLTVGQEVTVAGKSQPGRALCVCDDGSLLVRFPDGQTQRVNSGEANPL